MEIINANRPPRPLLIYDGDCGFCTYWARYWEKLTGDSVSYAPYQEAAAQYPAVPLSAFRRAVQYVAPDGKISSAAEASFLTLSNAPGGGIWLFLYRYLPGFAAISEYAYAFIANRRPVFHRLSLFLWGRDYMPPRFDLLSSLFLRCLGLVYLAAFVSFGVQVLGLVGSHGILPLQEFIGAVQSRHGMERYWLLPMLFWLNSSDMALQAACWGGAAVSLLLVFNVLPRLSLLVLYTLYLSLFYAGQNFMTFQWDLFLLEVGALAIVLCFTKNLGIWLLRWLLFRFMFMAGAVKMLSGDPVWRDFSALSYHFLTQPLPTPLAWYAHHLPQWFLSFSVGMNFFIELFLPFLIFFPRRLRFVAFYGFLLLQSVILLTGNYNFFNFLTLTLCLVLFDDAVLHKILPQRLIRLLPSDANSAAQKKIVYYVAGVFALLMVIVSCIQLHARFGQHVPAPLQALNEVISPLRLTSVYGPFAVMTTKRPEIIFEGSDDGLHWSEYSFKYKPGDINRPPLWNIPHQPRLDWQLWFAAMAPQEHNPWVTRFVHRLLENSPEVTGLMENNPFSDKAPLYIRALLYDYRFTAGEEKEKSDAWWERQIIGRYFPTVHLIQP